jgi:hypothetical protein
MPRKQQAIIDFSTYTEAALPVTTDVIAAELTLNAATFPGLPVTGAALQLQNNTYRTILGKPDYAGKAADLGAARLVLETSLRSDGVLVNTIAKGDLVILQKSGYPLSKTPQPIGPLPKSTLELTPTNNKGEFTFKIKGVKQASGYIICITPLVNGEADPHKWQWFWCPKSKGTISNLDGSTRYKAVSVAVGSDPQLTFSDQIERTTQ